MVWEVPQDMQGALEKVWSELEQKRERKSAAGAKRTWGGKQCSGTGSEDGIGLGEERGRRLLLAISYQATVPSGNFPRRRIFTRLG